MARIAVSPGHLRCYECKQEKPVDSFAFGGPKHREGRQSSCRECKRIRSKNTQSWKREDQKQRMANYYQENKEARKAYNAAYGKANPDVKKQSRQKRRALEQGCINVEVIYVGKLYERDQGICQICRQEASWFAEPLYRPSVDHIIPLSKGGTHTWDNIQLAHVLCNTRKHAKLPEEFVCA